MLQKLLAKFELFEDHESDNVLYIFVHIPKCAGTTVSHHIVHQYPYPKSINPFTIRENIVEGQEGADITSLKKQWLIQQYLKKSWIETYLRSLSVTQRNAIRCIYGHLVYDGIHELFDKEPRYFTFLREPTARYISFNNYHKLTQRRQREPKRGQLFEIQKDDEELLSLNEWLETASLQAYSMTNFLAQVNCAEDLYGTKHNAFSEGCLEKIKNMLENFYFVGLTESADDMNFVYNRLTVRKYISSKQTFRNSNAYSAPNDFEAVRKFLSKKYSFEYGLYEYVVELNRKLKAQIPDYDKAVANTRMLRGFSKRMVSLSQCMKRLV